MQDERHGLQQEAVELSCKQTKNHTLVLGTGFGKSKVAIDIIKKKEPKEVLILVNNTELRDFSWQDEFNRFKATDIWLEKVEIVTYQTACRWTKDTKDLSGYLVICDEVDFAADTDVYANFFREYSTKVEIIGFTGFITKDKQAWFDEWLPVVIEYTVTDAQKDGKLNKIEFEFVKYQLSRVKNLKVEYKSGDKMKSFMTSENDKYEYEDKRYRTALGEQAAIKGQWEQLEEEEYKSKMDKISKKIEWIIKARNAVLLNSDTTANMAKDMLIQELLTPNNKAIVFSVYTKQSQKVTDNVYNGSIKSAVNKQTFINFNSSKIRSLGVCTKVNRGVNFVGLNVAIFETFYGSDTQMMQRLGRLTRLDKNHVAKAIILLPYFYRLGKGGSYKSAETRQVEWARKALKESGATSKNSTIKDLRYIQ